MRNINADSIIEPLRELIENALFCVEREAQILCERATKFESSKLAKFALERIVENNKIAEKNRLFACQDCGQAVLFVNVGQDLHIRGSLTDALNKAVECGYKTARKSVAHSLNRTNTDTNTPAIIHYNVICGDKLEVIFLAKGAGSENMSRLFMLTPSKGENGIIKSVVSAVLDAGANPCPPIILGVGIGGTMEKCAILSKLALTRKTGEPHKEKEVADLEQKILTAVNDTKIGAQGLRGDTTALAVMIEHCPTHIGMLPVAVNIQCHSVRHGRIVF